MLLDAQGRAHPSPPPMTNAERQRRFRQRHPDYYRLLKARERAERKARCAEMKRLEAVQATLARREPLMLPAPAERIEVPGINTIPAMHELEAIRARRAPEPVPVPLDSMAR